MPEPGTLIAGLFFGLIGIAGLKIGKNIGSAHKMVVGAALIGYPYFVENPYLMWGIGILLSIFLFHKD